MTRETPHTHSAFLNGGLLASGPLESTLHAVKMLFDDDQGVGVLIFEDATGRQVDFDMRGSWEEVLSRVDIPAPSTPKPSGRPRLGVVAREVTLLPKHWAWLESQPQGMSAALRRLVEEASKKDPEGERLRLAVEAAGRVMTALAGDRPGFEEALRALYARDMAELERRITAWPADIQRYVLGMLNCATG